MVEAVNKDVARFRRIVEAYDKAAKVRWIDQGKGVIRRYADERKESEQSTARYNILWSNVETLKPFLYSQTPKPVVERRYKDSDPVARVASEVLERALTFTMQESHFGSTLRNARDDYLLPGRGTGWVRYVPHFKAVQVTSDTIDSDEHLEPDERGGDAGTQEAQSEELTWEQVIPDYVNWKDFGHSVAPTWEEVDCVWRLVRMSRDALIERFGEEIGSKIPLDVKADNDAVASGRENNDDRAGIYELWCKSERRAVWFSKAYPELIDDVPDPLGLDEFFPCPRPIFATLTTESLIPTPDYVEYQDQAMEIDDLTGRIKALTKALKAAGVYDASIEALKTLLGEGHDNELIAVDSWAALAEKGGLKGAMELLPMQEIAQTLLHLYESREKLKGDLYEITGMSDIIRGNTAPSETATAQQIKSNFATKRLAERQGLVARFAGNLVAIMGNVIAKLFSPETLMVMTGVKLLTEDEKKQFKAYAQAMVQAQQAQQQPQVPGMPPAAPLPPAAPPPLPREMTEADVRDAMNLPTWDDVFKLLRNDTERRFRIDIETDTLVAPDDAQEQQAATQFLEATAGFLNQAVQASEQNPVMAPLFFKMLMFGVRRFRIARDLEADFEKAIAAIEQQAQQPQQQKPDPNMAKVQGQLQLQQQQQQFDQQMQQIQMRNDAQMEAMKAQLQAHTQAQIEQMKAAAQQQTAALIAHIQNLGKIEVARITADATADAQAEQHELNQGA